MRRICSLLVVASFMVAGCDAGVRKYLSRPLRFRYAMADQETSATAAKDEQHHSAEEEHPREEEHVDNEHSEHDSEYHEDRGKKGHEGYKDYEEHEKKDDKHLKKDRDEQHFKEANGDEGSKHHDEDHYVDHRRDEKDEKSVEFGEEGKHQKGHSTKGEHNIFKKVRLLWHHQARTEFILAFFSFRRTSTKRRISFTTSFTKTASTRNTAIIIVTTVPTAVVIAILATVVAKSTRPKEENTRNIITSAIIVSRTATRRMKPKTIRVITTINSLKRAAIPMEKYGPTNIDRDFL
ncbi:putative uncharacterized protein DDB_G0281733 isoform X1 [Phymastichus coffea]|uniref:putative uncharacterized protein DDB_G0281733 isoform X1 n=1 Tax=Phymastichus coffea TaxID=108790 RepID=UPI00273C69BF|nr:putative uncharacterized protein DDB_G0281733 isoform X1 [Phymastichus coffea]